MASIYVSRLPHYVKDWDLRNFFQKFGRVVSVRVNHGGQGMKSAFVNFADASSAKKAVENHYPVFLGRRISVNINTGSEMKPENPYSYSGSSAPRPAPAAATPAVSLPIQVKTEPGISLPVKQEPGILRPGDAWSADDSSSDPYHRNEFSVSSPPSTPRRGSFSADPFQGSAFSVSTNPFEGRGGPQVATVFSSPPKSKTKVATGNSKSVTKRPSVRKEDVKRRLSDAEGEKTKKKVMSIGNLKPPRSAAEFVESQKKLFEDKNAFADDSPEEAIPDEIVEEKKRIVKVLNTGPPEKLQRLQLIGKKKADAIIAYRRLRGKFRKVEDLAKISLFGDQFMQKFKEANFIG